MTVYLPTLKQLQYLVTLQDTGHFGKAAESCFVTQSTLSASLRELESLIGVTLVERNRRVVGFTPLGVRIAEKARRVLREAEELADMARAAGQPLAGDLRMGVIPTIAPFLLPTMLPALLQALLTSTQKISYAIPVAIIYPILSWIGFNPKPGGHNSDGAILGMTLLFVLAPVALMCAAAWVASRWPLDREAHARVQEKLAGRG